MYNKECVARFKEKLCLKSLIEVFCFILKYVHDSKNVLYILWKIKNFTLKHSVYFHLQKRKTSNDKQKKKAQMILICSEVIIQSKNIYIRY